VRILNYPITIPSATTAIGGIAGAAAALRSTPAKQAGLRRGLLGSTAGALAGALTGSAANAMIAQGNRPQLPTIGEYELGMQ
jgi:outer membrane lipoprotein SlyB